MFVPGYLAEAVKIFSELVPQTIGIGGDADGNDIVHESFDRALLIVHVGAIGADGVLTVDVKEDAVGESTYTDSILAAPFTVAAAADEKVYLVDISLEESAGQIRAEFASAVAATLVSAIVILYNGQETVPYSQEADVVEQVLSVVPLT